MSFPSYLELIKHYNFFLLSGPILLLLSLGSWRALIRSRRGAVVTSGSNKRWNLLFTAVVTSVIGLAHLLGIYASVLNAWRFRRLEPGQVTGLSIQRMAEEGRPENRPPVIVRDAALIQEGLGQLATARSRSRNHESFSDGYRIQLLLGGAQSGTNYYLSVYRSSSGGGPVSVVIPHVGADSAGTANHGGEYSCVEFGEWVRRRIDPLF
jgi:hypothetical protein